MGDGRGRQNAGRGGGGVGRDGLKAAAGTTGSGSDDGGVAAASVSDSSVQWFTGCRLSVRPASALSPGSNRIIFMRRPLI